MRIQHNISAMNAYRNYNNNAAKLSKNLEKLSSGYKINRAGDDAAGLAISEKMRAQITGLDAAGKNVKDGISLVKTAEGAMQEIHDMLGRMKYLATQASNGTYNDSVDRNNLQMEVDKLKEEINRIADSANFNGQKLLDGSLDRNTVVRLHSEATSSKTVGADFNIMLDGYKTFDGSFKQIGVEIVAHTSTKATISTSGTKIKIYLKKGTASTAASVTAEEIQNLIRGLTVTAKKPNEEAIEAALKGAVVTGNGVHGAKGGIVVGALGNHTGKGKDLDLQIGDDSATYNKMGVNVGDMHVKALGIDKVSIATQKDAGKAVDRINDAINYVSSIRGNLGATQNRLEHTQNNLSVMKENIQDAEATIRDTDVADEMTAYTKNNILLQSAQAMLAQANQMPQGVLQLLQ